MQIYEALKKDHKVVLDLVDQLVRLTQKNVEARHDLIEKIRDELVPHSRAEEAVFYNSMRLLDESKDLAMHGYQEHLEAEGYLRSLQIQDVIDVGWKNTALKLQEALQNHIAEEEGEMFAMAQRLFTAQEAEVMAEVFQKIKPAIQEEDFVMTTVEMMKNLMPPRLSMAIDDWAVPFVNSKSNSSSSEQKTK